MAPQRILDSFGSRVCGAAWCSGGLWLLLLGMSPAGCSGDLVGPVPDHEVSTPDDVQRSGGQARPAGTPALPEGDQLPGSSESARPPQATETSPEQTDPPEQQTQPLAEPDIPNTIVFRIAPGTGRGGWNTKGNPVIVPVGYTLRIINEDPSAEHTLHAGAAPCRHGPFSGIPMGAYYDCGPFTKPWETGVTGYIYDHFRGRDHDELFWVRTDPAP